MSVFCIYTILHTDKLDQAHQTGGKGCFTENTKWVTGSKLFHAAQRNHERMPIIFGAADKDSELIYFAMLESVDIDDIKPDSPTTTYCFVGLKPIKPSKSLSSLKLRSTGKPLSNKFIRPYAICYTPDFVKP